MSTTGAVARLKAGLQVIPPSPIAPDADRPSGVEPAMQTTMKTPIAAEAMGRLKARPPSLAGLSRKSPRVAPSGRVRMKAAQNNNTRDAFVQK